MSIQRFDSVAGRYLPEREASPLEPQRELEENAEPHRCLDCARLVARGQVYCDECRDDALGPVVSATP